MDDRVATALRVLGPLEIVRDGECVRLGSGQQRRLLAVLLVHGNEVVSSDRLVDVLWADGAPPSALPTLRTLVSRLRATLGADCLETRPPGYRLRVASAEVDASRFEELVRAGLGSAEHAEFALGMFDEALELWRGSPYQEFASEEFAATEVARLVELRARAIEERSAALLELGRPEEVIGDLEAEIAVEPFRERLRALLMLALARSGRPVESLRAYDDFRRFLRDEVGVVPSPGLQELNDDIVRQHPDVSWGGSPTKDAHTGDLPSGTVTFLFTDVEGSTRLWEEHPDLMHDAMPRHDELLRDEVASHGGFVVKTTGDGFHAVFASAHDAVTAAVAAQSALAGGEWNVTETVRVRMGIHTGEAEARDGDYSGSAVNRAARLMSVAHGGQIVVSTATAELLEDALPEKYGFVDLGEHRLHDLARRERIFQVVHPELPAVFPPLRSLDMFPSKLPSQLTAFVGRERELTEVARALGAARVVTLTGIAGVGKTRLALEAAARALAQYRDGAWFCELAPVGPGAAVEAVATALGVVAREGHTIEDGVLEFLRVKQLLLVLDNCEHLLDSVTDLVDRVVRACPRVTVLATSRECLALKGERILPLQSLLVPDLDASTDEAAGADAVRLFVERSADARAGFVLHDDNAAAIVQICRRLDGIPLAIELAAARVQAMTPEEIASRLDDQFGLLRGGTRGAVARHQTLRRAIDWSYDLLSDDERLVLQRLAVFAGGATLNDAVAVVGADTADEFDVLEQLGGLVRRSLVLADDDDGHTRYRLLETVRQYAHERLQQAGAADTTHRRHAVHYAALAEHAGRGLRSADQLAWLARLTPEMDNLRAAQAWAIDQHELDLALAVIVSLCVIGTTVEHAAIQWARALATDADVDTRPLGPTLLALAAFDAAVGWPDQARATAFEARRIAAEAALGRPPNPANLRAPTILAQHFGTPADAVDCARRWVEAARAAGDRYETVEALTIFAATMADTDIHAAVSVMEECVAEARELACPSSLSIALIPLGVHLLQTDPKQSVAILEEAVRVGTTVGFRFAVGLAYSTLAWAYHALGDQRAGLQARRQALDLNLAVGGGESLVGSFISLAVLLTAFGDDEAAAVLQGAAIAVPDLALAGTDDVRALIPVLRERLGDDRLRELLDRGSGMPDDESVAYAHAKLDAIEASWPPDD